MLLTIYQLRAARACTQQRERFRSTFGLFVHVTPELCQAYHEKFDFSWAATQLMPDAKSEAAYDARLDYRVGYRGRAEDEGRYERDCSLAYARIFAEHYNKLSPFHVLFNTIRGLFSSLRE